MAVDTTQNNSSNDVGQGMPRSHGLPLVLALLAAVVTSCSSMRAAQQGSVQLDAPARAHAPEPSHSKTAQPRSIALDSASAEQAEKSAPFAGAVEWCGETMSSGGACAAPGGVASGDRHPAEFPVELQGLWIGAGYECPTSGHLFDGESFMEIQADRMVGYEEILEPKRVQSVSGVPTSWKIDVDIDVGPSGVFQDHGEINFVLEDGALTRDDKPFKEEYRKCP